MESTWFLIDHSLPVWKKAIALIVIFKWRVECFGDWRTNMLENFDVILTYFDQMWPDLLRYVMYEYISTDRGTVSTQRISSLTDGIGSSVRLQSRYLSLIPPSPRVSSFTLNIFVNCPSCSISNSGMPTLNRYENVHEIICEFLLSSTVKLSE